MRRTWYWLLLGLFSSPSALASGMNPVGKNAWDYYVFGNGPAIYKILESVKMLMLPWGGGGMFESLLIAIALLGSFLVIIEAGFSPSKGVEKLIGYFITLAFVVFLTMGARVNVTINDNATGYYNTVTDVPAIVGVPAAVISEIGYKLEQGIEEDFSIPDGLKVSKSGMYDVMGQTLKDANRMVITDPDLKRSLTGYVENCVVPSIGLGRVSVEQLMSSSNLLSTFSAASTPSLMTPYFPMSGGGSATNFGDQGTLEQCSTAYGQISTDVKNYAGALISAQSAQWQSTGIMVPFASAMQDVLQEAASGGGGNAGVSGYGSPEDYILQSALLNTSRPAFQTAAAELGENPVMLSTAISQADQAQRSSWFTTVTVFHNMMGYVYIVLQAFVLALVPIIAVMLLIPGMGAKIFLNYLQVLLWLVLWGPLFAVENFVVAVHGGQHLHNLLAPGLSMLNSADVSEATVNMNLAASFLGTLIPLLAWGIVKGSFAFTEFIMAGMASSFAQQAGSLAATGNVSLGNTSLDNVGMNKYSTSITSDVGDGGVNLGIGGGALSSNFQEGGYSTTAGKTLETPSEGYQRSWSAQIGNTRVENLSRAEAQSIKTDMASRANTLEGYSKDVSDGLHRLRDNSTKLGIHTSGEAALAAKAAHEYAEAAKLLSGHGVQGQFGGSAGASANLDGGGVHAGASAGASVIGRIDKAKELLGKATEDSSKLLKEQKKWADDHDTTTKTGWDDKSAAVSKYHHQFDTSDTRAHDALDTLSRTISEMKNVNISEGFTRTESQSMLPSAGGSGGPGETAVTPGGTLGQFAGQSPMSAGGAAALTRSADRTAGDANWAANGVPGVQAQVGEQIGREQAQVAGERGSVTGPHTSRTAVNEKGTALATRERFGNMGVDGSIHIVGRRTKGNARQVGTSSVLTVLGEGGVRPNLTGPPSRQIAAILRTHHM